MSTVDFADAATELGGVAWKNLKIDAGIDKAAETVGSIAAKIIRAPFAAMKYGAKKIGIKRKHVLGFAGIAAAVGYGIKLVGWKSVNAALASAGSTMAPAFPATLSPLLTGVAAVAALGAVVGGSYLLAKHVRKQRAAKALKPWPGLGSVPRGRIKQYTNGRQTGKFFQEAIGYVRKVRAVVQDKDLKTVRSEMRAVRAFNRRVEFRKWRQERNEKRRKAQEEIIVRRANAMNPKLDAKNFGDVTRNMKGRILAYDKKGRKAYERWGARNGAVTRQTTQRAAAQGNLDTHRNRANKALAAAAPRFPNALNRKDVRFYLRLDKSMP
ncbi:MAG TPA: hypothetical protein VLE46_00835 [Nitrospira sp.]|nr:hypothetical protein [Nitrospira sp.]